MMQILLNGTQVNKVFNNIRFQNVMFNLAMRWADEKGYEDIKDYAKPIEVKLNEILKADFTGQLKMTKRPFGFKVVTNYSFTTKSGAVKILPAEITFKATASGQLSWQAKAAA